METNYIKSDQKRKQRFRNEMGNWEYMLEVKNARAGIKDEGG